MSKSHRGIRVGVFIALLFIMGSLLVYLPEDNEVEAVGSPVVSIRLAQQKMTAYVAPGMDGIVTFTGTVTAIAPWSPSVQQLLVFLIADASGWAVTNPPALPFTKGQTERDFAVTVQVPPETSHMLQGTLQIAAKWRYSPGSTQGNVEPVSAIIYVAQYYQFSVGCEKPYMQVGPGQSLGFKLRLINEGNANDKLRVEVTNLKDLNDKGWTVQLSQDKFQVPEKQERVLQISITTPVEWNAWKNDVDTIQLRIVSSQAESTGAISDISDYSLYIRQRGVSVPGFEPTFAIMALAGLAALFYGRRKRE